MSARRLARGTRFVLAAALSAFLAGAAGAQTLTIGVRAGPESIDPHFTATGTHAESLKHIFDTLVWSGDQLQLEPRLAESWRAIGPTTWEFRLRQGVRFHDGSAFTAEDVKFSIERVPLVSGPNPTTPYVRQVREVRIIDPHTIHIETPGPSPTLPNDLIRVFIVSHRAAAGLTRENANEAFNTGRAAIGTGPYRLVNYRSGDRLEIARYDGYWGPREPWARSVQRFITNDAARTAALLAGDVDFVEQIPTSDLARLRRDNRVTITEIASTRTVYMAPDYSRNGGTPLITDNAGQPLPVNPFRDVRVRRALSMAINRDALVERVMEGAATATAQWLPEGAFGYNPAIRPMAFDPDGARRLLAEAGYPEGFRITMHTPNDRWPNDARLAQAVAQMWTRIGVRTQVEALPWTGFVPRRARIEYAMQIGAWGSSTGEGSNFLVNTVATNNRQLLTGANNNARFSSPVFDALAARGSSTLDDAAREAIWREAVALYAQEQPLIQLVQYINTWAVRRGLTHDPRMDERTIAMGVRQAVPGAAAAPR